MIPPRFCSATSILVINMGNCFSSPRHSESAQSGSSPPTPPGFSPPAAGTSLSHSQPNHQPSVPQTLSRSLVSTTIHPSASGGSVPPAPVAVPPDPGNNMSRPPNPPVAKPVEAIHQPSERTPAPGFPPHSRAMPTSQSSRPRSRPLKPSSSIDSSMTTRRPHFDLGEGLSTIDESTRAHASGIPARSRSTDLLSSSGAPASRLTQPNKPAVDFNGRSPAHPRKAATIDESHYHRPLTSTVRELLHDNFRYGFGCPPISYDDHDCPQIQNFGCRQGMCSLSVNFHVKLIMTFTRDAPESPHSSALSSEWASQCVYNHHSQCCLVTLTARPE
jgi:hypothetical protein